jgi:2-desacetyl-2-hydroxyethyl bacteriochlorophyllide A dehydrogenase
MRQAVMVSPGRIEFKDVPIPVPGEGEVLLEIKRIGICGSDIHVWHGRHPLTTYPVVQGHEFSAVVREVGKGVREVKPGMRATARPQISCGRCRPCLRSDYHICQDLRVQGFQAPGCAQEYFVVPESRLVVFPDSLTFEQGALIEPAAVGAHSTRRITSLAGRNAVVAGAGTIGNLVAQFAGSRGAEKVLITDISDFRLKAAGECGLRYPSNVAGEPFAEAVLRSFGEDGFQAGFEAAGAQAAMDDLVGGIEKGGEIVVLGVFDRNPTVNMSHVGEHELKLIGSLMYKHEDYLEAVDFLAEGRLNTAPLVTKHFPFEEYRTAYEFIEEQGDKSLKVMIDV